jgi:hypothetical protein
MHKNDETEDKKGKNNMYLWLKDKV